MGKLGYLAVLFCVVYAVTASELVSRGHLQFPDLHLASENYLSEPCAPLNDIWGFESGDSSYAVVGVSNGIAIVDVTDEHTPNTVSFPYSGCITSWRDMKTFQNYLYVVNDFTTFCDCSEEQQPCQQQLGIEYQDQSNQTLFQNFRAAEGRAQAPLSDFPQGVSGILVQPADPLACSAITEDLTGKIAFVDRGDCTFTEKTLYAQAAGASGIVIADQTQETIYPSMSGNNTGINIPGLLIGSEDADTIKTLMGNGIEVTAILNSTNREYSSLYSGPDGWIILDISDPTNAQIVNQTNQFFDFAHNILVDPLGRGLAYVCGQRSNSFNDTGGVLVFDLAIPHAPQLIANFSTAYIHDIEVVDRGEGLIVLYGAAIEDSALYVIDVSDPWQTPDLNSQVISVTETVASPHNTAQSLDGDYLYITHEEFTYPVTIWDSSDLENLIYLGNFSVNAEQGTSPHNAMIDGTKLWMSYYSEGVLVYDIAADPVHPDQLGQYDTSVDFDSGFHGVWGIFPYTHDPNLAYASDIESGLWVLRLVGDQTGSATPTPMASVSSASATPVITAESSASATPMPVTASVAAVTPSMSATNGTSTGDNGGDGSSDNTFLWITVSAGVLLAILLILVIGGVAAFIIVKKRVANKNSVDDFDGRIDEDDLF